MEFWFDFGSNYSYLSAMRIEELAHRQGERVQWKPMLLGPIFKSLGWESSPFVLQKEKGAYVWTDMARQCAKHGLAWRKPSVFPRASVLPARLALCAGDEPWVGAFCRDIFTRNFVFDQDIDSVQHVSEALEALGLSASMWIERAVAVSNKDKLRSETERARALGVFGAPTFFVGQEMFWGNDRLEDAFDAARAADAQ